MMRTPSPLRGLFQTAILLCAVLPAWSAEFYVSPSGTAGGNGSLAQPWNLQTALNQPAAVRPGDTIWLRGGTYSGHFTSRLTGTEVSYITVRQYPGERAILSGVQLGVDYNTLVLNGAYATYWGFEIMHSVTRRSISESGSNPAETRPTGVTLFGHHLRLINLIIHDNGSGIGSWSTSTNADSEIYGNLVFNNGWLAPDRGHGHGMYAQNRYGYKRLVDNIVFNGFNHGLQVYGSGDSSYLNNFHLEGNAVFNSGIQQGNFERNILVGGGITCASPQIIGNYMYFPRTAVETSLNVGYRSGCTNAVVRDNYSVGALVLAGDTAKTLTMTGNSILGVIRYEYSNPALPTNSLANFPGNTHSNYGTQWTGTRVFIRPNRYEPGRGHVIVYNWDRLDAVNIDLSAILGVGTRYEVRDVQNFFGTPLLSGTYAGGSVSIPMPGTGSPVMAPVGNAAVPPHTDKEFNVFVVLPTGSVVAPPPPPPPVNQAPTVATAASATPNPVAGTTSNLSVLGSDDADVSALTYTWATTGTPPAAVTFSANGNNATRNTTATFTQSGTYSFAVTIRDAQGLTATSSINVSVTIPTTPPPPPPPPPTGGGTPLTPPPAVVIPSGGQSFYASPTGVASGNGSIGNPWPLQTALNHPAALKAGDTLWLRGGTYAGVFTSRLTGTAAAPIQVRQYPGERATLDGGTSSSHVLTVYGSYAWFWDFEVTSFAANHNVVAAGGVWVEGANTRFINLIVHDLKGGYGFWTSALNSEVYGNVLYHNGYGAGEGRGHNLYVQNQSGVKYMRDNILLQSYSFGIHAYGENSTSAAVDNLWIEGNTLFNHGTTGGTAKADILIGPNPGMHPAKDPYVASNMTYMFAGNGGRGLEFKYNGCTGPTVQNNYLVADTAFQMDCTGVRSVQGNTIYGRTVNVSASAYPSNTFSQTRPTSGLNVFVRRNLYESGRANITIYNWSKASSVAVNVAGIGLQNGDAYEIRYAQNYFGPTRTGVYDGQPISIPMTGWTTVAPNGGTAGVSTLPEFGAFIIRKSSGSTSPPPPPVNQAPTVATAASATPNPVTGTSAALAVLGADDGGVDALTYAWATTGTPPAGVTFSANNTNAARNTTATFTRAGAYAFTVTIRDAQGLSVTSSVNVTVNATLTTVMVTPTTATVQVGQTQAFSAAGQDQFNQSMTISPAWTVSGGGSISSAGLFTAGSTAGGPFTVTATSNGRSGTASVSVTAAPNAAPTVATPANASPNPVTGTTVNLSALGADDGGVNTLTYTWATTGASPAGVTFSANNTNASRNTTATFTQSGAYSFLVTIRDAPGLTVTSSVNVAVDATVTTITVSPNTASVLVGQTQTFTAAGRDQFNQPMTISPTWTVSGGGSISSAGLFTAGAVAGGPFTVTATSSGRSGTASVNVINAAPTVATPASATPNPVTATTTQLSVLGADNAGENTLTYAWATTGTPPASVTFSANNTNAARHTTVTFTRAGTYAFTVTIRDAQGLSVTSSVNVTVNAALTTVTVTPTVASVQVGQSQAFSAAGQDQFNQPMTISPTWTVSGGGSINSAGLFTAGSITGGPFTITAAHGARSGTASVTINTVPNNAPTVATPASVTPNPVTATSAALSVLGADDGGVDALTYAWATTGTPPASVTFSANNTNAARNTTVTFTRAGTYSLIVTIRDAQGLSTTSSVNVAVNAVLTRITVTPNTASIQVGQTQSFGASGEDQFNQAMPVAPVWTVTGGKTISSTGLFEAGATAGGPFTVTATSGGRSGTASISVTAAPNTAPTVATPASASPNPVTGTTVNLSVLGSDDGGVDALAYTWATTGTPPASVTFSANNTNAARNTTATFTRAGTYSFTVTIRDAQGLTVTSSVNATVNATLTTVTVAPTAASVLVGQTQAFTAAGRDQFNQAMTISPAWTVSGGGSISSAGLFTAGSTAGGPFIVTATSNGRSGTASVSVTAAPNTAPTVATPASASPNPVTVTTTQLSVLGADNAGENTLTYTWATTGTPPASVTFSANNTNAARNTTASFTRAGTYSFTVTIRDAQGLTATSSVNMTVNATLITVTVTPAVASVLVGQTQTFTAAGRDQFNQPMTIVPAWTVSGGGSISSAGLFRAGSTTGGPFTVTAASGGRSGTASVSVTAAPVNPPGALPIPDLSGIHSRTYRMDEEIVFNYPYSDVNYEWVVESESLAAGAGHAASRSVVPSLSAQSLRSSAPRLAVSQLVLEPGSYTLRVDVTRGAQSVSARAGIRVVSASLSAVRVYPNPWKGNRHGSSPIVFSNLMSDCTVRIFTASGHLVMEKSGASGSWNWNLQTRSGDRVASGIYLYVVESSDGTTARGKIAIVK